jgi:hypothetical protein
MIPAHPRRYVLRVAPLDEHSPQLTPSGCAISCSAQAMPPSYGSLPVALTEDTGCAEVRVAAKFKSPLLSSGLSFANFATVLEAGEAVAHRKAVLYRCLWLRLGREQRRDPAIPITTVLAGKLDDRLRECIFVFTPDRTITLRAAWLVRQPASPALRHPMLLLCMGRCDPSSLRA